MTSIEKSIKELNTLQRKYQAKTKKVFSVVIDKIFKDNLNIDYLSWLQYTPYFNDGDPCTFSVGDVEFFNKDDDNVGYLVWTSPEAKFMELSATQEFLENEYGDHVKVRVYRNGKTEVEDYDHD